MPSSHALIYCTALVLGTLNASALAQLSEVTTSTYVAASASALGDTNPQDPCEKLINSESAPPCSATSSGVETIPGQLNVAFGFASADAMTYKLIARAGGSIANSSAAVGFARMYPDGLDSDELADGELFQFTAMSKLEGTVSLEGPGYAEVLVHIEVILVTETSFQTVYNTNYCTSIGSTACGSQVPEQIFIPYAFSGVKNEPFAFITNVSAGAHMTASPFGDFGGSAKFEYGHTGKWLGVTSVTDGQGNPITDYTLVDAFGNDWKYPAPDIWTDLGTGISGTSGVPELFGYGTLKPNTPAGISLVGGAPSSSALMLASLSANPTPFKGGVLIPVPAQIAFPFVTDPTGGIDFAFTWPMSAPALLSLYLQCCIQDSAAVQGIAVSNALKATSP